MNAAHGQHAVVVHSAPSMGGTLNVFIAAPQSQEVAAQMAARRVSQRAETWAARLTRFDATSHLSQLNAATAPDVPVRPTLAAALRWAKIAERRSEGVVDATQLNARLAAESGIPAGELPRPDRTWQVIDRGRHAVVRRNPSVPIDLDGFAKGWIADRAADLLASWPGSVVDADGDICVHVGPGVEWLVEVADPRPDAAGDEPVPLATLKMRAGQSWSAAYGVATSGTSVHRWQLADGRATHHLIDPRTGQPAETDVLQATVVAPSAREAEMIAKSAVILGSHAALGFLVRSAARAAILLLESGEVVGLPGTEEWLA